MKTNIGLTLIMLFFILQCDAATTPEIIKRDPGFIENKGQFYSQHDEVLYIYSGDGFNLVLQNNGFTYELYTGVSTGAANYESGFNNTVEEDDDGFMDEIATRNISSCVGVSFVKGEKGMSVEASEPNAYYTNY